MVLVKTWTDAPVDYDGFGTRTLEVVALLETAMGSRPVRMVETPAEHVEWQRMRYASGGYLAASEQELPRIKPMLLMLPPAAIKPVSMEEVGDMGMRDGMESARESGSADPGPDGWDGRLINSMGREGVCRLFGEPMADSGDSWSASMAAKLARYSLAAQLAAQNTVSGMEASKAWDEGTR